MVLSMRAQSDEEDENGYFVDLPYNPREKQYRIISTVQV